MKKQNRLKAALLITLTLILTATATANNATYQFEAFSGTIDGSGDLTQDSSNVQDYGAAVYDFQTDSFEKPERLYTEKQTSGENITLNFNISDNEKHHYGVYFYKRNNNGEDEYITYEYTLTVNKTGNNVEGFDSTLYNTTLTFAKKTGASSNITLEQFDELAAGDPVHVGVNITAESPIDHTAYTDYIPDSSLGGPNLTEFYQTDVGYSLNIYNKTNDQNDLLENKERTGTVTIDFGDYKRLEYTTIDETGVYNITGETDPTVDLKVESGTNDTDSVEVQYLSKIKTNISSASNEYVRDMAEVNVNLKDNLPAIEANIAKSIEYSWLDNLTEESLIERVRGAEGLDAVASNDRTNYTVEDSGDLPAILQQPANGDWYLCLRAWVEDGRSIITKGETDCRHFMVDNQDPVYESVNSPTGTVTYNESGYYFNATVSDNIQLEEVNLTVDGALTDEKDSFTDPSGSNDISNLVHLGEGSHNYEWRARDKVMLENSLAAAVSSGSVNVDPLAPQLGLEIQNTTNSNSLNQVYWNDTVRLNATTQTMYAPLDFSSNLTGWNEPTGKEGSYTEEITLDKIGTFNFEATAGQNNQNYTEETQSKTVDVLEIQTDAKITLLDENGNEINSAGLMENVTIRADPQATQKNSKAPVNVVSNLTLSEWNEVNQNGVYEQEIQMKQEGTFEFNMSSGETGTNSEGFTDSNDSATLTVSSSNGGDETLEWNKTIQDQEIYQSEAFNYGLEVNYTGTSSDLIWNVLNDNFTVSTGNTNEEATVTNSTSLETGQYQVPVEVYDSGGNYLTDTFNVKVTSDLYWNNEPSDQSIDEGTRYSQDLSGNLEYIGDKTNLTWNITQNRDLFTVGEGLVEDKQELSSGSYVIGLNVTDEENRKINTSYTLTVNEVSSGGGGTTTVTSFSPTPTSPEKELNITLSSDKVARGVTVTVSGTLTEADGTENITLTVEGEQRAQTQVESDGSYQTSFTANTTGNKTVKASTSGLETSTSLEVVEPVEFNSTTYPETVEPGEQFQVCGTAEEKAEIKLYREQNLTGTKTAKQACFNQTLDESGSYDYRITVTANGKTVENSFTVEAIIPSSSTGEDFTTGTEDGTEPDSEESDGFFGSGSITGAFSQSMSGTAGKVGISILGGLIITLLILLGL